jgi:hypothetical protein
LLRIDGCWCATLAAYDGVGCTCHDPLMTSGVCIDSPICCGVLTMADSAQPNETGWSRPFVVHDTIGACRVVKLAVPMCRRSGVVCADALADSGWIAAPARLSPR